MKGKYWYRTHITWCPVCGKADTLRVRHYTKVPNTDDPIRYTYTEIYDHCDV